MSTRSVTPKRLWELKPKLHILGIRKRLLALHSNLFDIHDQICKTNAFYPSDLTSLEKLVIVLEDRRFFSHYGVDTRSVAREFARLLAFRTHGGASTIDMQFVRTVTGYKELTLRRKVYECVLATVIQRRYSKVQILRAYLNCAFFGSHLIGASKASRAVFGVSSADLSNEQAAFIAAMLVCPRPTRPSAQWQSRVQRRADYGYSIYINNKDRFDQYPS